MTYQEKWTKTLKENTEILQLFTVVELRSEVKRLRILDASRLNKAGLVSTVAVALTRREVTAPVIHGAWN